MPAIIIVGTQNRGEIKRHRDLFASHSYLIASSAKLTGESGSLFFKESQKKLLMVVIFFLAEVSRVL